ncbi:MAG: ankyrin repeat domain-containing protein [Acidobacteriota bacterium]
MTDAKKEIIKAAKSGNLERIKALIGADPHLIHARDSDGSTPLHCAAWKGHQAVVAFLLSVGADVNAQNNNGHWGTTPLHAAAHANQALIAQMLIEHSADVNAKDMSGKTPLHHTTSHNAKAAAKVLQEQMLKG